MVKGSTKGTLGEGPERRFHDLGVKTLLSIVGGLFGCGRCSRDAEGVLCQKRWFALCMLDGSCFLWDGDGRAETRREEGPLAPPMPPSVGLVEEPAWATFPNCELCSGLLLAAVASGTGIGQAALMSQMELSSSEWSLETRSPARARNWSPGTRVGAGLGGPGQTAKGRSRQGSVVGPTQAKEGRENLDQDTCLVNLIWVHLTKEVPLELPVASWGGC